jgi:nitrate reductase delta subunit
MDRDLYGVFADLFEYPGPDLAGRAGEGAARLAHVPAAAASLGRFREAATAAARLEEAYTSAFDLQPQCAPYLGHHLCGESHRRSLFLVRLRGLYQEYGFGGRKDELPDHLAVVLRFLATGPAGEEVDVLVRDGLAPALDKMLDGFGPGPQPYRDLLAALREALQAHRGAGTKEVTQ